ncbi:MAG TPA: manganese efflux pump MntP family protein [Armatimonadota bacterium]|nr:manganese efflux pump MntP family protein [Armatimonadota bacterium]
MDFASLFLIAISLAMDASAVALAVGCAFRKLSIRPVFRLSFHFGLFQALMPILGWLAGTRIERYIAAYDHWIAFGLLAYVGINMLRAEGDEEAKQYKKDPTRGSSLVMLSVATSIDALAVGLSFGMLHVSIWFPSLVIGVVAAACTLIGMLVGNRCGAALGRRMELAGGLVLLCIGLRILYTHLA